MLKAYQADGPRKVVLKDGLICFQDTRIGCFVLNISTGGAGLVLDSDVPIVYLACRLIWIADPEL